MCVCDMNGAAKPNFRIIPRNVVFCRIYCQKRGSKFCSAFLLLPSPRRRTLSVVVRFLRWKREKKTSQEYEPKSP